MIKEWKKQIGIVIAITAILLLGSTDVYAENNQKADVIVSFLGDSVTTYKDITGYDGRPFYYSDAIMPIESTWWMQILNANHWTLGVNDSIGGSRVSWDGITQDDWQANGEAYYMASDARIKNLGKNGEPDKIFVFGGMNDILSQEESNIGNIEDSYIYGRVDNFANAYYTMICKIKENYPNVEIICLIPYHTVYSTNNDILERSTEKVAKIIQDICNKENIRTIDLRKAGLDWQNDMESSDYIHPNEGGMKKISDYILNEFTKYYGCMDANGDMHYFRDDGTMVYNEWYFDGTWTYYLQYDGTPMKDRLTYHPDGEHIIYLDKDGHEVFNNFQYCPSVGYTCYFDSQGYIYKDQITFVGDKIYYLDANGAMEQSGWFQYANGRDYGYANPDGTLKNSEFSYDAYGRVVYYHWNGMVARGWISDGSYYYNMNIKDGHYQGSFKKM